MQKTSNPCKHGQRTLNGDDDEDLLACACDQDELSYRQFLRCHLVTASAHNDSLVMYANDDESTDM